MVVMMVMMVMMVMVEVSTAYQKLNRLNQDLNLSAEYKINLKSRKTTFLLLLENDFQQTVSIYFQA